MVWRSQSGRLRWSLLVVSMAIMLTLAACGDDDQEATPTSTPTDAVATAPTPTPEPEPTSTPAPEPTATPTMYVPAPTVAVPIHQPPAVPPTIAPDVVDEEPEQETPVPDPTATPQPEPEPEGDPPPPTETAEEPVDAPVISHPLTGLAGWEIDYAQAIPVEDGFQIVNVASDGREIWDASYMGVQLADVVAMVDVRDVGASWSGYACIAVRTAAEVWDYAYAVCLNGYGESFAEFKYIDVDGNYFSETLAPAEVREGTRASGEWNTLAIAAVGQDFAFYINDTMIGTAIHPSIESGGISFGVGNFEEAPAQWVFAHLDVWDAQ